MLERWAAERVGTEGRNDEAGWLVLTSDRCRFVRKEGLFGRGRRETIPVFSLRLEEIRSVEERASSMAIGYGDHVRIAGLSVNGEEFRLGRDTPSGPVVAAIRAARLAREPGASPP